MAATPDETRQKISIALKKTWENPELRARASKKQRKRWTPERRAAMSAERKEFWRRWREDRDRVKAILAREAGNASAG